MSALFEMHVRIGADPRGYAEFAALRDELAKLGHPACPDVDWQKVEQLCLVLLQLNGVELQTVSFYALARSQRHGLDGMVQGVRLLKTLSGQWSSLWPSSVSVRLDILGWLFAQLHTLLRSLALTACNLRTLLELDHALTCLNERLVSHTSMPLMTLQALQQQVKSLIQRLERIDFGAETALLPIRLSEPAFAMPIRILPPPNMKTGKRRLMLCLYSAALVLALAAGFAWRAGLLEAEKKVVLPDPVRLDSLSLFDAGSSALKPGSTDVLVKALIDIKAQPGWLIIVAGHTDATGSVEQNLQLSHSRASAVRDWMQRVGSIPVDCFAVQSFADSQPIADNDTEAGRMANRRVDIRLVPQVGACERTPAGVEDARAL
ncbi:MULTISPECIES: OmpA family protein [unclassified Pseudomonas]|uniref:OmpA family protein n=1 Tax=unclassified Pseudomonas TaxID=196821 RepID=UPI0030D74385